MNHLTIDNYGMDWGQERVVLTYRTKTRIHKKLLRYRIVRKSKPHPILMLGALSAKAASRPIANSTYELNALRSYRQEPSNKK